MGIKKIGFDTYLKLEVNESFQKSPGEIVSPGDLNGYFNYLVPISSQVFS